MFTIPHSESNGALERTHSSLKEIIRFQIHKDRTNWDEFIDTSVYSFNTDIHSATGFTPFELLFERKPRITYLQEECQKKYEELHVDTKTKMMELQRKAIETQTLNKEKSKKRYDKKNET